MRTKFFGPKTCDLHSRQPASNFFLREEKIIIKKKTLVARGWLGWHPSRQRHRSRMGPSSPATAPPGFLGEPPSRRHPPKRQRGLTERPGRGRQICLQQTEPGCSASLPAPAWAGGFGGATHPPHAPPNAGMGPSGGDEDCPFPAASRTPQGARSQPRSRAASSRKDRMGWGGEGGRGLREEERVI